MGRARRDAPGPLRGPRPARRRRRRRACSVVTCYRATTLRRDRRTSRRSRRPGRSRSPGWPRRRSTSSICRRRRRSTRSAAPRRPASGSRAETCPHYLVLTDERYDDPDPVVVRPLRHLAAAPRRRRPRRAVGGPRRRLARPRRHGPRPRPARRSRRPRRPAACRSTRSATARPGIETLLAILYSEGVAQGPDHARADGRPARDDAGSPVRARDRRARSRSAATPTSSCSTRPRRRTIRAADLHHTSDYTPTRASRSPARSARSSSAAPAVIRDGAFVGRRGFGRFVERAASPVDASTCVAQTASRRPSSRIAYARSVRNSAKSSSRTRRSSRSAASASRPSARAAEARPAPRRGSPRSSSAVERPAVVERDALGDPHATAASARSRRSPRPP